MSRHPVLFVLLAMAMSLVPLPSNADHVVLVSEAQSFRDGQILEDPLEVTLVDGERLVLLSDRGDVLEIEGPFTGAPSHSAANDFDVADALTRLIDNPDHVSARLGSTRSAIATTQVRLRKPEAVWRLDPFTSGGQCVVEGMTPVFRRQETGNPLQLVLQRPGSDGSGTIAWAADAAEAHWPREIPLHDDDLYVVRREGWVDGTMFRLAILPAPIRDSLESAIAWLAVHGCKSQAETLMRELKSGAPDTGT